MPTGSCSWDRRINSAQQRFKVLTEFNSEAVLDRETGLVWERRPSKDNMAWPNARLFCAQKAVGRRGGWRLPAFSELVLSGGFLQKPAKAATDAPSGLKGWHPQRKTESNGD